eukprot:CAMPEP_0170535256 /NCGR_PEP_ID=MMETSP0209-20121228/98739_1 /TAXON_ID=665100 ORGANISM="Litonotus pictus, Strain P1" /NCGR_SAMPLE_ID=MMETSP0209 /ASSEMBLY_ACC=CAM_ASM_000301 /LENGTH=84 /DNA_ID=CAMNT_0010835955 /DNA_START=27 /DNA_END=278 /DNA_ORIENTATION=-
MKNLKIMESTKFKGTVKNTKADVLKLFGFHKKEGSNTLEDIGYILRSDKKVDKPLVLLGNLGSSFKNTSTKGFVKRETDLIKVE